MKYNYRKLYGVIKSIKKMLALLNVKVFYFVIASIFSVLSAFFEMISVSALIPLAQGIIKMDFSSIQTIPLVKRIVKYVPFVSDMSSAHLFIFIIFIVVFAAAVKCTLSYISVLLVSFQIRRMGSMIRQIIFGRYISFSKMFFDRSSVGYLYTILMSYTASVINVLNGSYNCLNVFFFVSAYLIIMCFISWKLTLIGIIVIPLLNVIFNKLLGKIKQTSQRCNEAYNKLSKKISNTLSAIPMVKIYSNEAREMEAFARLSTSVQLLEFSIDKKRNLMDPLREMMGIVAVLSVLSLAAFLVAKDKSVTIAGSLVFFYVLRRFYTHLGVLSSFMANLASVSGPLSAIRWTLNSKDKYFVAEGKAELNEPIDKIEFKGLSFSYVKDRVVLKDLSFVIEKGKITAIVGPTGSGKTTMVNLIMRFYDCPPNSIFINGVDIRDFTFHSLMKKFAYVSQDTLLFNDTIKENLIYGLNRTVSQEELALVIHKARLSDFIDSLTDGINTIIGDRGIMLSGGEKQRVSIARAFLKGAEILILDEATSSLDTKTEHMIQGAMEEAMKGKTVIAIAHRLSTIKNAHKILVIENGTLIEGGTLEDLLQKKGKFYESWNEQKFY